MLLANCEHKRKAERTFVEGSGFFAAGSSRAELGAAKPLLRKAVRSMHGVEVRKSKRKFPIKWRSNWPALLQPRTSLTNMPAWPKVWATRERGSTIRRRFTQMSGCNSVERRKKPRGLF